MMLEPVFLEANLVGPDRWVINQGAFALLLDDMCIRPEAGASRWQDEPIVAGPFESVEAGKAALVLIASSGGG